VTLSKNSFDEKYINFPLYYCKNSTYSPSNEERKMIIKKRVDLLRMMPTHSWHLFIHTNCERRERECHCCDRAIQNFPSPTRSRFSSPFND
jgi:hypothetical protein